MKDDRLWKATLDQLELRVSQGNFVTWFQSTTIKKREGGSILVETQNPFTYEWLSKKYGPLILEITSGLDSAITDVTFCVASQATPTGLSKKNTRIIAQKNPVATKDAPRRTVPKDDEISAPTTAERKAARSSMSLNAKYVFETYVVGASNEVAHAACRAVVSKPGDAYNPLLLFGGVGLGKTHLLQAVGNALAKANPTFNILYVASETFANDFVQSLRMHTTQQFKNTYRNVDVLMVDDIQFFAGKDKIQEELFHTFNHLHSRNKQVLLSSDRPPSAIPALQERLSSRLSAGMVADIKKPDYETRLAILEEKREEKDMPVDRDALSFIAKHIQSNVRELEGALNRVAAHCDLHNRRATVDYTKQVLKDLIDKPQQKTANTKSVIDAVIMYYDLSKDEICGKSRKKEIVKPRQVAMYLLRKEGNMSFPSIGEHFSGRDHTTAMHACEKIEKLIEHDEDLSQEIVFLKERIYA